MQVEIEKQTLKIKIKPNILVLVLKCGKDYDILGCKCSEWVVDAVSDYNYLVVEYDNSDLFQFAKKYANGVDIVVLLSANMPLLTKNTFSNLIDYCIFKDIKACKFGGGAVYNVSYLNTAKSVFYDSVYSQNEDQFYIVENITQRNFATEILRMMIIDFHLKNGVDIKNIKNVVVEKFVDIQCGAIIESGNVIKGNTHIDKNVILKENNTINDSVIGANTCIAHSVIESSTLGKDCIIMPYTSLTECVVGNNVIIMGNVSLKGRKIKDNRKI